MTRPSLLSVDALDHRRLRYDVEGIVADIDLGLHHTRKQDQLIESTNDRNLTCEKTRFQLTFLDAI